MAKKLPAYSKMGDIARLSVDQMVSTLGNMYIHQIKNNIDPVRMPSIMLWSMPGTGKSQGVRQIAKKLESGLGRKVLVTDVRLLLFNPVDLRGIPVADMKNGSAVWLKPRIFDMDSSNNVINILFLDEISAAPPSVQAAAYQIVLDRSVGEHQLPNNCIVIGAGNRVEDKTNSWKMPTALANRFCHLEIVPDPDSWRRWAIESGIHPLVTGYMACHPDHLCRFDPESDETAFCTPRTWEMVSKYISCMEPEAAFPLVCGCIGFGAATEFDAWTGIASQIPAIRDIFEGAKCKLPKKPDVLYALVSSMSSYASVHRNDMLALGHSLAYASNFPPEFSTLLLHDYLAIEPEMRKKLVQLPEFDKLQKAVGKYL